MATVSTWAPPDIAHHDIVVLIGGETEDGDALISEGCNDASRNLAYPGEGAQCPYLND